MRSAPSRQAAPTSTSKASCTPCEPTPWIPANTVFRDWLACQMKAVIAVGIMTGKKYMRPLHSLMQWNAHRVDDEHDGAFVAVVGDRVDSQDSLWVKVSIEGLGWTAVNLPINTANN